MLLTILLNVACNFVYNIDVDIVHIVHIARVLINCTYHCQYCTILLDIAHKIAQVWFADGDHHQWIFQVADAKLDYDANLNLTVTVRVRVRWQCQSEP